MELFVPDLKKAKGRFLNYHEEVKINDPEIKVPSGSDGKYPVLKVFLKAAYVNSRVLIKGHWQTELTGECSRCLEQTDYTLKESFSEEFIHLQAGESGRVPYVGTEKEEQYLFKGESLKLDEYFKQSFFISQPLKVLCREDCKGLCPICGRDRNKSLCSCTDENVDHRWSLLKKLLE